jgi:hypothetical protein
MFKLSYSDEESREPKKWESTISSTSTRTNQDPQFLNLLITARKALDLCLMNPADRAQQSKNENCVSLSFSLCLSVCLP